MYVGADNRVRTAEESVVYEVGKKPKTTTIDFETISVNGHCVYQLKEQVFSFRSTSRRIQRISKSVDLQRKRAFPFDKEFELPLRHPTMRELEPYLQEYGLELNTENVVGWCTNGNLLFIGYRNGAIKVIDSDTGVHVQTFETANFEARTLYSHGNLLVCGFNKSLPYPNGKRHRLILWDFVKGIRVTLVEQGKGSIEFIGIDDNKVVCHIKEYVYDSGHSDYRASEFVGYLDVYNKHQVKVFDLNDTEISEREKRYLKRRRISGHI